MRAVPHTPGCSVCGCRLARDNPGTTCGPCDTAARYATSRSAPHPTTNVGLRELVDTWSLGFPAFQEAAGLDETRAAALAESLGLIPTRWLLTGDRLAEMARRRSTPTATLAERWRVSRWTVATWRRELGLQRVYRRSRAEQPWVDGVRVVRGERTRLIGPGGSIRLGRSARTFVEVLVDAYPDPVGDTDLRRCLFPDSSNERAQAALHATVSRLRRHLPDGTIRRAAGGYRLAVPPDAIGRAPEHG